MRKAGGCGLGDGGWGMEGGFGVRLSSRWIGSSVFEWLGWGYLGVQMAR